MTVSEQTNEFIKNHGGDERTALVVALAKLTQLASALEFYADKSNYRQDYLPATDNLSASNVQCDNGVTARLAISLL